MTAPPNLASNGPSKVKRSDQSSGVCRSDLAAQQVESEREFRKVGRSLSGAQLKAIRPRLPFQSMIIES